MLRTIRARLKFGSFETEESKIRENKIQINGWNTFVKSWYLAFLVWLSGLISSVINIAYYGNYFDFGLDNEVSMLGNTFINIFYQVRPFFCLLLIFHFVFINLITPYFVLRKVKKRDIEFDLKDFIFSLRLKETKLNKFLENRNFEILKRRILDLVLISVVLALLFSKPFIAYVFFMICIGGFLIFIIFDVGKSISESIRKTYKAKGFRGVEYRIYSVSRNIFLFIGFCLYCVGLLPPLATSIINFILLGMLCFPAIYFIFLGISQFFKK